MRAAWLIARKDLVQRVRNRSVWLTALVIPLALALIFGFIFGSTQDDYEFSARYAVVDLDDGGPVGELFIGGILGQIPGVELVRVDTVARARALAEGDPNPYVTGSDEVAAAFVIPAGFSDDVQSERPVEIQVIQNSQAEIEASYAAAIAQGYASELTSVRIVTATFEELVGGPVDRLVVGVQVLETPSPVTIEDVSADVRQLDGSTFYAAGMTVFFLFFTVHLGFVNLLQERYDGTLTRLLAAPISRASILAGKAIGAVATALISATVLVVVTSYVADADWGDPLGVAILVVAVTVAAAGIAALVSSVARTAEQATIYASNISTVLGLLGGTFFSLEFVGGWIGRLQFLSPHGWFMDGLADLAGGELGVVVLPAVVLVALGAVAGGIAMRPLRRGLAP